LFDMKPPPRITRATNSQQASIRFVEFDKNAPNGVVCEAGMRIGTIGRHAGHLQAGISAVSARVETSWPGFPF
jgi:hypothetical protein